MGKRNTIHTARDALEILTQQREHEFADEIEQDGFEDKEIVSLADYDDFLHTVMGRILLYTPNKYRRRTGLLTLEKVNATYVMGMTRAYTDEFEWLVRNLSPHKAIQKRIAEVGALTNDRLAEVVEKAKAATTEELFQTTKKSQADPYPTSLRIILAKKDRLDDVTKAIGARLDSGLPVMYQTRGFDPSSSGMQNRNKVLAAEYTLITTILTRALTTR